MLCVTCHGFITQISPGSSLAKPGGFPGIIGFNWQEFVLVLFSQVCGTFSQLLVQNSITGHTCNTARLSFKTCHGAFIWIVNIPHHTTID